ncbi:DUF642 domain-containing protein [Leucothrix sargassi]|nr:DUF642 domain-containing protein [Leucothrix sargassi]
MVVSGLRSLVLPFSILSLSLSISPSLLAETQTELVQNGSFEAFTVTKERSRWMFADLDHWQGNGEVWKNTRGRGATSGEYKIELDAVSGLDELSQSITTQVNQKYRISLDAYGRRTGSSDFEILIDGEVIDQINPDNKWQSYSTYFVGTGGTQTLTIRELETQSDRAGTLLDNVSVVATTELLSNGSFEDFTVNTNNDRWKLVDFANWEGEGEVWNNKIGRRSTDGAYKADLDVANAEDGLSQTVVTQDRFIYEVSLDAYARPLRSSDFEIWIDDEKLATFRPIRQWENFKATFTGNGQAQRLSIRELSAQSSNGRGAVIDNVSLVDTGERENSVPTISGTPQTNVNLGEQYSFIPQVTDSDAADTLVFSIVNKPTWASFNTETGELSGIPTEHTTDTDIQISVSDGVAEAQLSAFTIRARAVVNIAQQFGDVSQGGDYGNYVASLAVDGDTSTFNHTSCNATDNWWQVKIPVSTSVSKFSIQSRSGWGGRINDAKVYLSDTAFDGTLNEVDLVATLSAVNGPQETVLDVPKTANYLLVKAAGSQCLHMEEVEIYGQMPEAPTFEAHESNHLIAGDTDIGTVLLTLGAYDYQSDELSYSIVGETPFSIAADGRLSVSEALTAGSYEVLVQVSDGDSSTQSVLTVNVTSDTAVEDALSSGSATLVTVEELIPAALSEVDRLRAGPDALKALYADDTIAYDPGNRTQLINITAEADKVWPLIQGAGGKTLAAAGVTANTRFVAYGSVPMEYFLEGTNVSFESQFKKQLAWLFSGDSFELSELDEPKVIALSFAAWDGNDVKNWIAATYSNWIVQECNDVSALAACYANADLVITGWQGDSGDVDEIVQVLSASTDNGTPLLYLHTWYEAYNDIAHGIGELLGFTLPYGGNFWAKDAADWTDLSEMLAAISQDKGYDSTERMLSHFANGDYVFDLASCDSYCSNVSAYATEFEDSVERLRETLQGLDEKNTDLFASNSYRLEKLLILLGDKYRQVTQYPMSKDTTDVNAFLKALFADYSVYSSRAHNPVQADMGNFSRSDFSHINPTTKTIELDSKLNFRAAGVYALPGQTVEVTRNDSSDVTTSIFINTQRSGSTHLFNVNGYSRPKFLKSHLVEIAPGQTIKLTSPYGGPLQVSFNDSDLPVSFTFKNVGEHPFWNGVSDNERFTEQLAAGDYDWAELITPSFEVHSSLEKMRISMSDSRWGGAAALAEATMRYMHNIPHGLAGYQGFGIDPVPELNDFAEANDWTIHTLDKIQHMNADQASCGYGCSGNPYDAYWAFSPIGHGDVHELGHGLQGGKRFDGWQNHTMTNYYSYFTKSQYYKDTGGEPDCQSLPFESMFNILQAAVNEEDSAAYIQTNLWGTMGWSEGAGMFVQMMMAAQNDGALSDGWMLRGRLHMLEREYDLAVKSETLWNDKRGFLGFGEYTWEAIKAIDTNDWYLIAISYVTARDFSDYFDTWAMPYSETAKSQVAALGYEKIPSLYFKSEGTAYCYGLDKTAIAIDGAQSW